MKKTIIKVMFIALIISFSYGCKNDSTDISSSSSSTSSSSSSSISNENLSLNEVWSLLNGYWSSNDTDFVFFLNDNNRLVMNFGIWYSEMGRNAGEATEITKLENNKYSIKVHYLAQEETMINGPYPEENINFIVDLSSLNVNKLKLINQNDLEIEYNYFGETFEEAQNNLE